MTPRSRRLREDIKTRNAQHSQMPARKLMATVEKPYRVSLRA